MAAKAPRKCDNGHVLLRYERKCYICIEETQERERALAREKEQAEERAFRASLGAKAPANMVVRFGDGQPPKYYHISPSRAQRRR